MWHMSLAHEPPQGGPGSGSGSFPERPGQPNCAHYMRTGLCSFGSRCKFNHPTPKRLAAIGTGTWTNRDYPERIGEPECQYYLKTGTCKFGTTCKFHHPRDKGQTQLNVLNLPLRPGEKDCAYYMRTGACKYEITCKYNHPQPYVSLQGAPPVLPSIGMASNSSSPLQLYPTSFPSWPIARGQYPPPRVPANPSAFTPAVLPSRQGVIAWNPYPTTSPMGNPHDAQHALHVDYTYNALIPPQPSRDPMAMNVYPSFITGPMALRLPTHPSPTLGNKEIIIYPERPNQLECQHYMKTGECGYGANCKFHHPRDRNVSSRGVLVNYVGLPYFSPKAL